MHDSSLFLHLLKLAEQGEEGKHVVGVPAPILMGLLQEHRLSREVYTKPQEAVHECCFGAGSDSWRLADAMLRRET